LLTFYLRRVYILGSLITQGRIHEYKPLFLSSAQNSLKPLAYQSKQTISLESFPLI